MKRSLLAMGAAFACLWQTGIADAQTSRSPVPVSTSTFDYDYYAPTEQPSPSDLPVVPETTKGDYVGDYGCSGIHGGDCACSTCLSHGCCNEPWRLFPEWPLGFTTTGWINGGGVANADNSPSRFNGPLTYPDRREMMVNQVYAVIERKAVHSCDGWDVGARMDLLFGTDYFFTQAVGLETDRTGGGKWNNRRFYGLAMPQAYLDFAYGDLSVKVGHFYTLMGNESVAAPYNFFYTHSYTFQYAQPFTFTGVMTSYNLTDRLTIYNGITSGWDIFDRASRRAGYTGGSRWVSADGLVNVAFSLTTGDEFNSMNQYTNRTMYSLVVGMQMTDRLQYVIQHDHGWQDNFFGPNVDAEWYGLNQYLFYTINDCWKLGTRIEWFRDDDGTRVTGLRPTNPIAGTNFVGNFYEISLGLNWLPTNNLVVRPEVRWDWFDGTGLPYDDGTKADQFVGAVDMILQW